MGIICLVLALVLAALAYALSWWWMWIFAALAAAGGAFSLFEARNKWCAVRAMGIQTRL
jgi:hypothetical protein